MCMVEVFFYLTEQSFTKWFGPIIGISSTKVMYKPNISIC